MINEKQNLNLNTKKIRVYLSTLLTVSSLGGIIAMFSMIKDRLNKQLQLQQGFLSILDSLLFIGRILGSIIVLVFPSTQPKKAYFIACACASLCQLLLPVSIFFGPSGKYVMLFGMLGAGICKAYIMTPFLFLSQQFHEQKDKPKVTIWNSLNHIGDVVGLLFTYLTVYQLQMKWDLCYQIAIMFYFIFAIVFYLAVQEKSFQNQNIPIKDQNQNIEMDDYTQSDEYIQQSSVKTKIIKCYSIIVKFYRRPSCFLWCIDYSLQAIFISSIVSWFPYYFVQNGFGANSAFIAVAFYIANMAGTIIFESFIQKHQQKSNIVCAIMLFAEFFILGLGTMILGQDKNQSIYYILMLLSIGFFSGGVCNRIGTADFLELVGMNGKQVKYYGIFFAKLVVGILAVLVMTLIGHMMQKDQRYLFYIMICNILLSLIVYITRKFFISHFQTWLEFDPLQYAEVEYELNSLE